MNEELQQEIFVCVSLIKKHFIDWNTAATRR